MGIVKQYWEVGWILYIGQYTFWGVASLRMGMPCSTDMCGFFFKLLYFVGFPLSMIVFSS